MVPRALLLALPAVMAPLLTSAASIPRNDDAGGPPSPRRSPISARQEEETAAADDDDDDDEPVTPAAADTPRPALGPVPYGVDIRSCTVPGKVALTYDDGPGPYTARLLDILGEAGARATFFVVGTQVDAYPGLAAEARARGHQVGSHTYTHADLEALSTEQRRAEVVQNEEVLARELGGVFPTYLRPPYTSCSAACVQDLGDLGYHVANYDVDTKDYLEDYEFARNAFSSALASGSPASGSSFISLEHDIHQQTVESFTQFLLDTARGDGYDLVTMGECLGDPPANWYRDAATGQAAG